MCLASDFSVRFSVYFCVPMNTNILMLFPRVLAFFTEGGNPFSRGEFVEGRNDCEKITLTHNYV